MVERQQPQAVDAEPLEVVELLGDPAEVAGPVAVGIAEPTDQDLVEDGPLEPAGIVAVHRRDRTDVPRRVEPSRRRWARPSEEPTCGLLLLWSRLGTPPSSEDLGETLSPNKPQVTKCVQRHIELRGRCGGRTPGHSPVRAGTIERVMAMIRRRRPAVALALAIAALAATACQPKPIPTAPGTDRVVILGDSVPAWLIRDGSRGVDTSRITLANGTLEACDGAKDNPPARSRTGAVIPTPTACAKGWPSMYPPHLTIRADVAVVMTSTHAMLDHQLAGVWRHPCHTPARTWYQEDMTARLRLVATKADKVVLVLPAWPGPNVGWIMPADSAKRADCVRSVLKAAAKSTGATVVDFGTYLCPTGATSCNTWRSADGMHIDKARAATALAWLINQAHPPTSTPA